jgi:acyl-coenzyme A synthetase/AMP-(fatty) acid ligase
LTRLAYFKAPGWVAFVDTLPITATLKIQRAELKRLAEALLDRPTTFDTRSMKKRGAGDT